MIALARQALATTPRAWYYVRAIAWLYLAVAYQMAGRLDQAYAALAEGQAEDVAEDGAVRTGGGLTLFRRVDGGRICRRYRRWPAIFVLSARPITRHESLGWAHYLLSSVAYQRNDLQVAEAHAKALEDMRYLGRPMAYLQSAFIYASICQARGLPDQARAEARPGRRFPA